MRPKAVRPFSDQRRRRVCLRLLGLLLMALAAPAFEVAAEAMVAVAVAEPQAGQHPPQGGAGILIASHDDVVLGLSLIEAIAGDSPTLILTRGRRVQATVLQRGAQTGAVLFSIPSLSDLPTLPQLAAAPPLAATVWTMGNPFAAQASDGWPAISRGIISGHYVIPADEPPMRGRLGAELSQYRGPVFETTAAINDGNQGGPLLDDAGRVVALVSLGLARPRRVGTAIPIADILADLDLELPLASADSDIDPINAALLAAAREAASATVLVAMQRPRGPGNPPAPPRPAPLDDRTPPYLRRSREQAWGRYHHAMQLFYTDQAIPALVIDAEQGLLLTAASNLHGDAEHGLVLLDPPASPLVCQVHARHQLLDLALLKSDGPLPLTAAALNPDPGLQSGDPVAVIGRHRDSDDLTLTTGLISATQRRRHQSVHALHQTDALVNYASLGAPVVDLADGIVAITVHHGPHYPWGINAGVGMLVDSATILAVLPELVDGNTVTRHDIVGLGVQLDRDGTVTRVIPNLGAAAAGILPGDRIRSLDGRPVGEPADISRLLVGRQAQDRVQVGLERDDDTLILEVTLEIFDGR